MNEFGKKVADETVGLAKQVYIDALQPAVKETGSVIGRTVRAALFPLRGFLWGWEKVEAHVYEGLERRLASVSPEKIKTPAPEIVVPALQALVYTGEVRTLREMYLNLLASAMNSDMSGVSHRAFVTIISQLSTVEALLLNTFRPKTGMSSRVRASMVVDGVVVSETFPQSINLENEVYTFPEIIQPIVNYYLETEPYKKQLLQGNVLLLNLADDVIQRSSCIDNLVRLGLIVTNFTAHLDENRYSIFEEHPYFIKLKTDPPQGVSISNIRGNFVFTGQNNKIVIEKGIARLTQFGYNFLSACAIENEIVRGGKDEIMSVREDETVIQNRVEAEDVMLTIGTF